MIVNQNVLGEQRVNHFNQLAIILHELVPYNISLKIPYHQIAVNFHYFMRIYSVDEDFIMQALGFKKKDDYYLIHKKDIIKLDRLSQEEKWKIIEMLEAKKILKKESTHSQKRKSKPSEKKTTSKTKEKHSKLKKSNLDSGKIS